MADETHGRPDRVEPSLDLDPKTDRNPDASGVEDMMSSFDDALGKTFASEAQPSAAEEELRAEIATLKDQLLRAAAGEIIQPRFGSEVVEFEADGRVERVT